MNDFEKWWNDKLNDKDFRFNMGCQYVWSDEEFKKLFDDCWSDARKSLEHELINILHSEDY